MIGDAVNRQIAQLRLKFAHPHDVWYNVCEGTRIAHREWKRDMSKYLRKMGEEDIEEQLEEMDDEEIEQIQRGM